MQNKGLISVFTILFALVCIYQLSFTFIAGKVEDDAKAFAYSKFSENEPEAREEAEENYLDSVSTDPVFLGIDYNTAKEKELNKGLDLKGGINVILEISVKDILRGLANNTKDPAFNQALERASELQKNSQDTYLESFFKAFEELPGENTLASPEIFFNKDLEDVINIGMTNEQVKPIIEQKIDESVASAFEVLRKRIDKFGVTQPNIQRLGKSARILVELPGAKDVDRVKSLLQGTAQLEFWDVFKFEQIAGYLQTADAKAGEIEMALAKSSTPEPTIAEDSTETITDSLQTEEEDDISKLLGGEDVSDTTQVDNDLANPILSKMVSLGVQGGPVIATFRLKDTAVINSYLRNPQIKSLLPTELRYVKFVWGLPVASPELDGHEVTDLYALRGNRQNIPPLGGSVVVDARQEYDNLNRVVVSMQMNGQGAKIWEQMTGDAYQNQSQIAIVLDNIVYSAPGVTSGPIAGGRSQISGQFTVHEGQDLANVLRAGKLPASAEIIQAEVVGPSLGQEAIDSGINSFVVALIVVFAFILFYYGKGGITGILALIVNLLFIFGVLAGIGAVLTLPGIAGIVLTIAMAVDANVLIFERIKEELANGKDQKTAINDGFKNALSAILDSNITTALTGVILLMFGTGPILGFATTLLIGIATSLFTALVITRLAIDYLNKRKIELTFVTVFSRNFFRNPKFDFIKNRKVWYIASGIFILIGIGSLFTQGLNPGIDFVGGRSYIVRFDKTVNPNAIGNDLRDVFESAEAKTFGDANQLKITTKYKIEETGTDVDNEVQEMLYEALKPNLPESLTLEDFVTVTTGDKIGILQYNKVGPTIADDIKKNAVWAILGALIVMFFYILMRFRNWQYGFGATVALFHDAFFVIAMYSLCYKFMPFSLEIDQNFIAAILTVVGYSINDTVVIFDRIREYTHLHSSWKIEKKVNDALNSTLSRTFNTSMSTLLVLIAIFIFGGESLRGFMFALIVGVVSGVYSTLFIATPLYYDTMMKRSMKKKQEAASSETVETK